MFDEHGNYFPEWDESLDNKDQQQTPDMGPFAAALKKRFASNKQTSGTDNAKAALGHAGSESGGMGGEGMKSL